MGGRRRAARATTRTEGRVSVSKERKRRRASLFIGAGLDVFFLSWKRSRAERTQRRRDPSHRSFLSLRSHQTQVVQDGWKTYSQSKCARKRREGSRRKEGKVAVAGKEPELGGCPAAQSGSR